MNRPASVTPEVLVCLGALCASWLGIIAQTPTIDMGLGTLIGNIGIVGVLVWHLWYHTTRSYPNMLEKFAKELESMRMAFRAEQDALRAADEAEKAELRTMLIQTLQAMRTAVHDVKDTAQQTISKAAVIAGRELPGGST